MNNASFFWLFFINTSLELLCVKFQMANIPLSYLCATHSLSAFAHPFAPFEMAKQTKRMEEKKKKKNMGHAHAPAPAPSGYCLDILFFLLFIAEEHRGSDICCVGNYTLSHEKHRAVF